ncbi:hypothetical protein [Streptomyces sp. NPDC004296]|uniref:hypothetical protein n=1 Tax=Streptomyces sp. NPDC004296 TaxID=3364697 RepID=UPI0036C8A351
MTDLPHDSYMAAVADALTVRGIAPGRWRTSEDDSGASSARLDAVFQWHEGVAHPEHWPHGVYLTWDQYDGWRLIEAGGGRNIDGLSPDSRIYCDPRQVAADVQARSPMGSADGPRPDLHRRRLVAYPSHPGRRRALGRDPSLNSSAFESGRRDRSRTLPPTPSGHLSGEGDA